MEGFMEQDTTYAATRRRVSELRDFYIHATIYAAVNATLLAIDLLTPGGPWFWWPLLGWGVGLFSHAVSVFGAGRLWGPEWEQRKTAEILARRR